MKPPTSPDSRAAAIAASQFGALTGAQARAVGLSPAQVRHRVRRGRWQVAARGVFVVAGASPDWRQVLMLAVLAGPSGTVASHLSAAALFDLWRPPPLPHLTAPARASARSPRAVVHHASLAGEDLAAVGPIACTRPARTLVDCAAVLSHPSLCELVDEALCRSLTDLGRLHQAMSRAAGRGRGRKGHANLRRALEVWTPGPLPGSPAEVRLLRQVRRWELPPPERQVEVRDRGGRFLARLDLAWPAQRVALEYDGRRYHGPRSATGDEQRQRDIEAQGWEVMRVRSADLRWDPESLRGWLTSRLVSRSAARRRS